MKNDLILMVKVPSERVQDLLTKGIASVIDDCIVSIPQKENMGGQEVEIEINPDAAATPRFLPIDEDVAKIKLLSSTKEPSKEPRKIKKLIKFVCPECNSINFAVIEREGDAYNITCRDCKTKYSFRERELSKAEYTCDGCGRKNVYFTPEIEDMALLVDRCPCGNKTKLSYSVADGIYIQA